MKSHAHTALLDATEALTAGHDASPARLPRAAIQRQEAATARDVKKLAKAGNVAEARTLAKAIVQARTQVTRISVQKARIADVDMQIANMASMARVSGAFEKSTQVMKSMNKPSSKLLSIFESA